MAFPDSAEVRAIRRSAFERDRRTSPCDAGNSPAESAPSRGPREDDPFNRPRGRIGAARDHGSAIRLAQPAAHPGFSALVIAHPGARHRRDDDDVQRGLGGLPAAAASSRDRIGSSRSGRAIRRRRTARQRVTPANFVDWRAQTTSFEALGALPNWTGEPWPFNVACRQRHRARARHLRLVGVLQGHGRRPDCSAARFDDATDDRTRGGRTVVISYRLLADSDSAAITAVVGRTLDVDTFRGGAFTVVGVMPPGFDFPRGASIWLSLADWGGGPMPAPDAAQRCCPWYTVFGRLRPGVERRTRPRRADARSPAGVSARHPDGPAGRACRVVPLRETLVGRPRADALRAVRRGRLHPAHRLRRTSRTCCCRAASAAAAKCSRGSRSARRGGGWRVSC